MRPTKTYCSIRHKRQGGMALLTTMLILLMVVTFILLGTISSSKSKDYSGVVNQGDNTVLQTGQTINSETAFNNAESGVKYTMQWLFDSGSPAGTPPTYGFAFAPGSSASGTSTFWGASYVTDPAIPNVTYANIPMSTGSFSIRILPKITNSTATATGMYYMIESIGYSGAIGSGGTMKTIVHAYVWKESLDDYAYMINNEQSGNYWVGGLSQADGPVHTNNADGNKTNIVWFDNSTTSQCYLWMGDNAFEDSAASANWYQDNTGNPAAPVTASNWYSIASYGKPGINYNSAVIPMPSTSALQEGKALGTATPTTATGVQIPTSSTTGDPNAGIFIHGAVTNMTLSVSNNVNQIITIQQTDQSTSNQITTVVTLTAPTTSSPLTGSTSVVTTTTPTKGSPTTTTKTYTGVPPSGVIYCDGSIGTKGSTPGTGLSGTVADMVTDANGNLVYNTALTVAVNVNTTSGSDINLVGSLLYNTQRARDPNTNAFLPETTAFQQHAGMLGLVADNIWLQEYNASGAINQNFEVDAATCATGTMDSSNYSDSRINGNFWGMGAYAAGKGGFFGVFNGSNTLTAGYNEHHNYDTRFDGGGSPPAYPTAVNWTVLSWEIAREPIS